MISVCEGVCMMRPVINFRPLDFSAAAPAPWTPPQRTPWSPPLQNALFLSHTRTHRPPTYTRQRWQARRPRPLVGRARRAAAELEVRGSLARRLRGEACGGGGRRGGARRGRLALDDLVAELGAVLLHYLRRAPGAGRLSSTRCSTRWGLSRRLNDQETRRAQHGRG